MMLAPRPTVGLSADLIGRSAPDIPTELRNSPQFVSDELSRRAGRDVVVKVETINPIRCFKGRGAWLAVRSLVRRGLAGGGRGVVVASPGNFALGVAYAGRLLGVSVLAVVPIDANDTKVAAIERQGAEVLRAAGDFDIAAAEARTAAAARDLHLLVDGEDPWMAVGAGGIAAELTDGGATGSVPPIDAAYVPVGDGSLIAGIGTWLRATCPGTAVVGVQSDAAPAVAMSWRAGRVVETAAVSTRADGLDTRVPIGDSVARLRTCVDDMVLVSERQITAAQWTLSDVLGITAEPAAAASWAGLVRSRGCHGHGPALVVVTGANIRSADWRLCADQAERGA